MAIRSSSDDEIQLKKRARRRLIGAVALVTLVVVFLPMVLDDKPKPVQQDIAISIPERQDNSFTSKIVPLQPQAGGAPVQPVVGEAAFPPRPAQPAVPEKTQPAENGEAGSASAGKPAVAADAPAPDKANSASAARQPANDSFVVQLGVFSSPANARQLQAKLSAQKIPSYVETLKVSTGSKTRVRAGPFASRAEAEKARDKLKSMGINGVVMPRK